MTDEQSQGLREPHAPPGHSANGQAQHAPALGEGARNGGGVTCGASYYTSSSGRRR